jgi:hypothetical protein
MRLNTCVITSFGAIDPTRQKFLCCKRAFSIQWFIRLCHQFAVNQKGLAHSLGGFSMSVWGRGHYMKRQELAQCRKVVELL